MAGNPQPFVDAVHAYLAHAREQFNYDQLLHTFLDVERFRRWASVVDRHRTVEGARFLSSGCGFAGSVVAYAEAGAARAVGVEVDPDYVRMGQLRVEPVAGAEVLAYDGDHLPFADASFDIVESMDVIEHTTDPLAYLAELRRVLAPGGVILLVTPNRLWPVEQHLSIVGPPWLPVGLADRLFGFLAERLTILGDDRRFKYRTLRGMRTQNLSLLALRRMARALDLHLTLLRAGDHGDDWPLPSAPAVAERLLDHRVARYLAPVPTLPVILRPE